MDTLTKDDLDRLIDAVQEQIEAEIDYGDDPKEKQEWVQLQDKLLFMKQSLSETSNGHD